jgi:hypothetical protein
MIYFSDVFGVEQDVLEAHGAFNIALVNDLPLFRKRFRLAAASGMSVQARSTLHPASEQACCRP